MEVISSKSAELSKVMMTMGEAAYQAEADADGNAGETDDEAVGIATHTLSESHGKAADESVAAKPLAKLFVKVLAKPLTKLLAKLVATLSTKLLAKLLKKLLAMLPTNCWRCCLLLAIK